MEHHAKKRTENLKRSQLLLDFSFPLCKGSSFSSVGFSIDLQLSCADKRVSKTRSSLRFKQTAFCGWSSVDSRCVRRLPTFSHRNCIAVPALRQQNHSTVPSLLCRPCSPFSAGRASPSLPPWFKAMAHLEAGNAEMSLYRVNTAARRPRILLAASGSVAAIKFANLCHCFSEWADVKAVATQASLHFIDRAAIPKDVPLYTDQDEWSSWKIIGDSVLHIELRKWADIMVIAPLSANTLGKIAGGLCDNLLTCIVRAWDYSKPMFVAPAMNTLMWNNLFTERHLMVIDDLGISLIPPVKKRLACGDYGNGAMAEPSLIFSTVRLFYETREQQSGVNA